MLWKHLMMYKLSSLKNRYVDKILITVGDLQQSSVPLIYQTEFPDYRLRIGDNVLSQHWGQKKLTANFIRDKNTFRYAMFTFDIKSK